MIKKCAIFFAVIIMLLCAWNLNSYSLTEILDNGLEGGAVINEIYTCGKNSSAFKSGERKTFQFFYTGESAYVKCDSKKVLEILGASVIKVEDNGEYTTTFAYTKKIKNSVIIFGKKVNIEICEKNGQVLVATPIAIGSF